MVEIAPPPTTFQLRPTARFIQTNTLTRLITLAVIAAFLVPIGYVVVHLFSRYLDYRSQQITTAKIDGRGIFLYGQRGVCYTFSIPGEKNPKRPTFTHWVYSFPPEVFDLKRHSKITISYLARDPDRSVIGTHYPLELNPWPLPTVIEGIIGVCVFWIVIGFKVAARNRRMKRAHSLLQTGQLAEGYLIRIAHAPIAGPAQIKLNGIPVYTFKVKPEDDASLVRYDYFVGDESFINYAPNYEFRSKPAGHAIRVAYKTAKPAESLPVKTIGRYYVL